MGESPKPGLTSVSFVEDKRYEHLLAWKRKEESCEEILHGSRPMDVFGDRWCNAWNASIVSVWIFPCGLIQSEFHFAASAALAGLPSNRFLALPQYEWCNG